MPTTTINLTGQALTKTDDTNVTLTLGGTPLTALLKATSLTLGWTGTLADSRIASAATWNAKESALTFSTGLTRTVNTITIDSSVVTLTGAQSLSNKTGNISQWTNDSGYLTSLAGAVTSVTGTLNRISSTGGSTPVIDIDAAYVGQTSLTTLGTIGTGVWQGTIVGKAYGGTGVNIATTALTLGTASSAVGSMVLQNATNANTITIQSGVTTSSHTLTLPVANASGVLTNNGSGALTWTAASSGITVGTTTITSGTSRRLGYNLAGVYQEAANELYFETASPYAHVFAAGRTGVITGLNNSFFGREAGKLITTGLRNTFIGSNVGAASTSSTSSSTLVGFLAGGNNPGSGLVAVGITTGGITSTGSGVAIGNDANVGNGASQTAVGPTASTLGSSSNSTALGSSALASGTYGAIAIGANNTATQSGAMALGYSADATHLYSIAFGYNATTTAANQLMVGNSDASFGGSSGITDICFGNGDAATSAASPTIRATSGSGSNNAGGSLTLAGGKGTGTAAGGTYKSQTSVKGSSGTTLQSLTDRHTVPAKYVDITDGAATTFGNLALTTSGTIAGGIIVYTVEANDGTDYQSLTGTAPYSVVNKAGTLTYVLGTDVQSSACSTGTLAGTLGLSASGTTLRFQMNAVSSLTETVLRISFQVLNQFGVATITAA